MISIQDHRNLSIIASNLSNCSYEISLGTDHTQNVGVSIFNGESLNRVTAMERNDVELLIAWLKCRVRDMESK